MPNCGIIAIRFCHTKLELFEAAKPLVEDAVANGDLTREEARAFLKEVTGLNIDE